MKLRNYQQEAHDVVVARLKKSIRPQLIHAPTGAGKSHIIAAIAHTLHKESGKRILCTAPTKELVQQNHEKYLATGNQASIYSASICKSLRHEVIFGTPISIKNDIKKFKHQFCAVIIDECHLTTPSILDVISRLRENNENIRVIGLTATVTTLLKGVIYGEKKFYDLAHYIDPNPLIEQGYLCPLSIIYPSDGNYYNTVNFAVQRNGSFKASDMHKIECSHDKTARIIHDIVAMSEGRKGKTLIFASTRQHAVECYSLLPQGKSGLIMGDTKERDQVIVDFKSGKVKYLVNVKVLTTGFDAPDIDTIALMRPTESKALLQQMVGRGFRPFAGKTECLVLDYAENIKRHCVDDRDIFSIEGESEKRTGVGADIDVTCPDCGFKNYFACAPNPSKLDINEYGYFVLLDGTETKIPAHMGRRCTYTSKEGNRCEYRWVSKICHKCGCNNDIAAKYCIKCKAELVNPDDRLHHKATEYAVDVLGWEIEDDKLSKNNRKMTIIKYKTEKGEIPVFYIKDANPSVENWLYGKYYKLKKYTKNLTQCPKAIKYEVRKGYANITEYVL